MVYTWAPETAPFGSQRQIGWTTGSDEASAQDMVAGLAPCVHCGWHSCMRRRWRPMPWAQEFHSKSGKKM